jgi:hypothetical protein
MAASTQIDAVKKAIRRSLAERDRRNGMVSSMLRKNAPRICVRNHHRWLSTPAAISCS